MKNLIIAILLAFAGTTYGQRVYNAPQTFNGSLTLNGTEYLYAPRAFGAETITARKYTLLGTYPLAVISANYTNDTLNLLKTNYVTGQIITVITTAALNDTLTITHDGSFAGSTASALISPATSASYKKVTIYFDGTNYWQL